MAGPVNMITMGMKDFVRFSMNKDPRISVLIGAPHGVGKSSIIRQIARYKHEELKKALNDPNLGYGFEDFRLAQNDVGDLKGIPYQIGLTTYFALPSWYPTTQEYIDRLQAKINSAGSDMKVIRFQDLEHGIILLDEMNRAQIDVRQVAFQLVLDRELNGAPIPDGWEICSAINDDDGVYEVEKMDPALLDRFWYVKLVPTTEEWIDWAKAEGVHPAVLQFIQSNPDKLHISSEELKKAAREGSPTFSPRSWHFLSDAIINFENKGEDILSEIPFLTKVAGGFLGLGMAGSWTTFVKNDYRTLSPKDVLLKFSSNKSAQKFLREMEVNQAAEFNNALMDEIVKLKKFKDIHLENIALFISILKESQKAESAGALWMLLLSKAKDFAVALQKENKKLILSVTANPGALK